MQPETPYKDAITTCRRQQFMNNPNTSEQHKTDLKEKFKNMKITYFQKCTPFTSICQNCKGSIQYPQSSEGYHPVQNLNRQKRTF